MLQFYNKLKRNFQTPVGNKISKEIGLSSGLRSHQIKDFSLGEDGNARVKKYIIQYGRGRSHLFNYQERVEIRLKFWNIICM